MKLIQRHIELFTSLTSLVLVWLAAIHLAEPGSGRWRTATIVALTCGGLSALAIWVVRRHRGEVRHARLLKVQGILHDIVIQQRAIAAALPRLPVADRLPVESACRAITHAVTQASDTLQRISEDASRDWQAHYADYRSERGAPGHDARNR